MKKLLATTAICLILGTGLNSLENSNESKFTPSYDAHQFIETSAQQNFLAVAANMYRGDFQQVAASALFANLYSGEGSAKIRVFRY